MHVLFNFFPCLLYLLREVIRSAMIYHYVIWKLSAEIKSHHYRVNIQICGVSIFALCMPVAETWHDTLFHWCLGIICSSLELCKRGECSEKHRMRNVRKPQRYFSLDISFLKIGRRMLWETKVFLPVATSFVSEPVIQAYGLRVTWSFGRSYILLPLLSFMGK